MSRQGFEREIWISFRCLEWWLSGVAGLRTRQGWATKAGSYDEVTPSRSGKEVRGGRRIVRRPARGGAAADQRVRPPPEPGWSAGPQVTVGLAGCVALEAADDLGLGQALFAARAM